MGKKDETPEQSGIVPDVWPTTFTPTTPLRVKFSNWVKAPVNLKNPTAFGLGGTPAKGAGEIKAGQVVTPTQAQSPPVLGWEGAPGAYYTVVMTDPDAPTRSSPSAREWVHWVRVNIPGDNLPCDGKDGGDNLKEYVGAAPPAGTGEHRYVILLFKQPSKIEFPESERVPLVEIGRPKWSCHKFAEEFGLGAPIGFSYFKASYDNYCLELYAALRGD